MDPADGAFVKIGGEHFADRGSLTRFYKTKADQFRHRGQQALRVRFSHKLVYYVLRI